jgi:hypothetical protein
MNLTTGTKRMIVAGVVIIAVSSMVTGYFDELIQAVGNLIRWIAE